MREKRLAVFVWYFVCPCVALCADVKFSGKATGYGAGYFESRDGVSDAFGEVRVQPKMTVTEGEHWTVFATGDFREDSQGYAHGVMTDFIEKHRWCANLSEAYGEFTREWMRVRAGKQIFDWSATDSVSPCDNISPRDWTDPLEWERVGTPALDLRLGRDTFFEVVYLPLFTQSKLPAGRWERELQPGVIAGDAEADRSDYQVATRVGTVINRYDFALTAYKGKSYSPDLKVRATSSYIELIPVYRDEEVYSASVAKEVAGFNVRMETGFFRQEAANDFVQYVVGVDREWGHVFYRQDTFYALVQYVNETRIQTVDSQGISNFDFRRVFNNALLYKLRYAFDEHWSIKLKGSYNCLMGDSFHEPAFGWQDGHWEVEVGVDLLAGGAQSFFGGYSHNDRGFLRCTYHF